MSSRISLRDVAAALGISPSTASRALSGSGRVAASTRARVEAKAREMGFRPDPVLSALAAKRWETDHREGGNRIAFVYLGTPLTRHRRPLESARNRAEALGYRLEEFTVDSKQAEATVERVLRARGIRSVILRPTPQYPMPDWDWSAFSALFCGMPQRYQPPLDFVDSDYFASHIEAMRTAFNRGYSRPVLIFLGAQWRPNEERRFGAIAAACYQVGTPVPPVLWIGNPDSIAAARGFVKERRPDLVIGMNAGVLSILRDGSIRIPQDTGFLALGTEGDCEEATALHLPVEELGLAAVDRADLLHRQNRYGLPDQPLAILIPGRWREGTTLPPRST